MSKQQKKVLSLIAGIVIVFGIGWYVFGTRNKYPFSSTFLSTTRIPSPMVTITFIPAPSNDKSGWKTFSDDTFDATFQYPSNWQLGGVRKDPTDLKNEELIFGDVSISVDVNPNNLDYTSFMKQQYPDRPDLYISLIIYDYKTVNGFILKQIKTALQNDDIYVIYNS